ncbi:MAG: hypothetical protein QM642_10860 [Edaphocola sp.]
MPTRTRCTLYYSVAGDKFEPCKLNENETLERTNVVIELDAQEFEELPNVTAIRHIQQPYTRYDFPHPIPKAAFFSSDTWCMFVDDEGKILHMGEEYIFPLKMMRDARDSELLVLKPGVSSVDGLASWRKK